MTDPADRLQTKQTITKKMGVPADRERPRKIRRSCSGCVVHTGMSPTGFRSDARLTRSGRFASLPAMTIPHLDTSFPESKVNGATVAPDPITDAD